MSNKWSHLTGVILVLASLAYLGWAPHNSAYGLVGLFGGLVEMLSAAQLQALENVLGKLPEASSLISLLQQLQSSVQVSPSNTSVSSSSSTPAASLDVSKG